MDYIDVGTVVRPTLFVVIPSRVNYNLLLRREWIHGMEEVPSTLHPRISSWRPDGILENNEAGQSYFIAKMDHVDNGTFD